LIELILKFPLIISKNFCLNKNQTNRSIRYVNPIPNMAEPGIAITHIRPPLVSAANPWHGRSFVIFTPSVLITLYHPKKVPNPIVVAADKITHKGISSSGSIECIL